MSKFHYEEEPRGMWDRSWRGGGGAHWGRFEDFYLDGAKYWIVSGVLEGERKKDEMTWETVESRGGNITKTDRYIYIYKHINIYILVETNCDYQILTQIEFANYVRKIAQLDL